MCDNKMSRRIEKTFGWICGLAILGALLGLGLTGTVIWAIIHLVSKV